MSDLPRVPLAAFVTKQHVPWCPDCAKHHIGNCADVDAPRDNAPTVNVNIRKDDDDEGSVTVVTDGTTKRASSGKRRERAFALTGTTCYRIDPETGERIEVGFIPKRGPRKPRQTKEQRTARKLAKLAEVQKLTSNLSLDEVRRVNGL